MAAGEAGYLQSRVATGQLEAGGYRVPHMPFTATGRYYTIDKQGKRKYNPARDKKVAAVKSRAAPRAASRAPARPKAVPVARASGSLGRTIVSGAGTAIGGLIGGPAGAAVGKGIGDSLSTIVGLGDYEIKKNVFLEGRLPQIQNLPSGGGTIIRHTEYLGDIITSATPGAFSIQSRFINPAVENTFPWLSQVASNYEEYSMEGLVFQFRSTSADALNSTNTALGSVMMATNYDASDPPFASKTEMLNYEFSTSCKPSESTLHMIECQPSQNVLSNLYTRPGTVPTGNDIRFYDLGRFQIATSGFQAASVTVGELHITYQVRLMKPKLFAALGLDINFNLFTNNNGVTALQPIGTAATAVINAATNYIVGLATAAPQVNLPQSNLIENYRIYYHVTGTVAAAIVAPTVTLANCTLVTGIAQTPPNATLTTEFSMYYQIVTLGNATLPTISYGVAGTFPAGAVNMEHFITQVPNP